MEKKSREDYKDQAESSEKSLRESSYVVPAYRFKALVESEEEDEDFYENELARKDQTLPYHVAGFSSLKYAKQDTIK